MEEVNPLHKPPEFRKVIVFNGPPDVGKDTAANYVRSFVQINAPYYYPRHMKFSEPLKRAAHAIYDTFHGWEHYDSRDGRPQKGMSNGDFLGLSPREAYIAMHEKYLKIMHGDDALGWILRKRIVRQNNTKLIVLSDSGFPEELHPIINLVGERNTLIVELHMAGKTFEGDSRSYIGDAIKATHPKVEVRKLANPFGEKDLFKMLCEGIAKNFLKIEEKERA